MWIASTRGFFSIVAHRDKPGHVLIRSRLRQDLVNLLHAHYGEATSDLVYVPAIIEMRAADYRFRILVSREDFVEILTSLSGDVEYDNFKNAVQAIPDQRNKVKAYLGLWSKLRELQPVE